MICKFLIFLPEKVKFLYRRYSPDDKRSEMKSEEIFLFLSSGAVYAPEAFPFLKLFGGKMKSTYKIDTKKLVGMAMFAALAYVVTFIVRIGVAGFLTFDAKDAIIIVASMIYGPVSGVIISFTVALIELISISDTGVYGFIMNFTSSAVFSSVAALVYKYKRTYLGAIVGFYTASVSMVAVMLVLNICITPFYLGASMGVQTAREQVMQLLPTVILPFNIAKGLLNTALAMIIYKPVITSLRRAKLIRAGVSKTKFNNSTITMIVVAIVTLAVALTIFFVILHGVINPSR